MLKSTKLTPDQIREIKEAFHVFDNNGDGCITATELKKLVTSLGYNITEAELMDMMNQIGKKGNYCGFMSLVVLLHRLEKGVKRERKARVRAGYEREKRTE